MKFDALIAQIKTEARVKADDNFDDVVIGLLNELFKEATEAQRPFELRVEAKLAIVPGTGLAPLPSDFFVHHRVDFNDADTIRSWNLTNEDEARSPAPRGMYGHPKSFEIVGTSIAVKPTTALVMGDQLNLTYYKIPPVVLTSALDLDNPIPRLEPFLIRCAIRRIRMLHSDDVQVATMLSGDISSAASAYTRDEPQPAPPTT